MPFDFEEYKQKCSTLSPEELQKEWENYTRHIAGGATSTAGSVLFAPLTGGASLVGLGLATPRIHNARKKRAIIEEHLQAHGTTHHTRKRDIVAPMAVAGTLGGLSLGFAGAGANLLGAKAAEKGVEYFMSHAALEAAGATLEHQHDKSTKLKVAESHGYVDGGSGGQKSTFLSPQASVRRSKSDNYLDGLAYGSLPGEKKSKKQPRTPKSTQLDPSRVSAFSKPEIPPTTDQLSPSSPKPRLSSQLGRDQADNLENWPSQFHIQNSTNSGKPSPTREEPVTLFENANVGTPSLPLSQTTLFVPQERSPVFQPRPQDYALPPRPNSSIGSYSTPVNKPISLAEQSKLSSLPPPQSQSQLQTTSNLTNSQYRTEQQSNLQRYSPYQPPGESTTQPFDQPAHVQFPQYQYFPPPPPPPPPQSFIYTPDPLPQLAHRPRPQPLSYGSAQTYEERQQPSSSNTSSMSSSSAFTFPSPTFVSPISAISTPLGSYYADSNPPMPMKLLNQNSIALSDVSPISESGRHEYSDGKKDVEDMHQVYFPLH